MRSTSQIPLLPPSFLLFFPRRSVVFLRFYNIELFEGRGFFTTFGRSDKLHIDTSCFAGMRAMYGKDFPVKRNKVSRIESYRLAAKSPASLLYLFLPVFVQVFRVLLTVTAYSTVEQRLAIGSFACAGVNVNCVVKLFLDTIVPPVFGVKLKGATVRWMELTHYKGIVVMRFLYIQEPPLFLSHCTIGNGDKTIPESAFELLYDLPAHSVHKGGAR